MSERPQALPVNMTNEQIILGNMLKSADIFERVMADPEMKESTFLAAQHQIIYLILRELWTKKMVYNEDSFLAEAHDINFGGMEYVRQLVTLVDPNQNIEHHIRQLKADHLKKRLLMEEVGDLEKKVKSDESLDLTSVYDKLVEMTASLEENAEVKGEVAYGLALEEDYKKFLDERANREFCNFYLPELDKKLTYGAYPGLMTVIASLTGQGKSTLCANLVSRWVLHGRSVLWCPLEEGGLRSLDKIIALLSRVPSAKFKKEYKTLTLEEKYAIVRALHEISKTKLHVYKSPYLSFSQLRLLVRKYKVEILVIDLFEKLSDLKSSQEQQVISEYLDQFQKFCQDLSVHGVITAQIRREKMRGKTSQDRRPTLDALKNTGRYGEAADLVLGLYRDKYFCPMKEGEDLLEIKVLKQRDGEAPLRVDYVFDKEYNSLGEYRVPNVEGDGF
jgi:replicative DNA helicase